METYFKPTTSFANFVYGTMVMQAYAVQTGIEALRRNKPHCMGSLYWQINDVWPVFSWASVDFYGQWKALHYRAREMHKNIMISIAPDNLTPTNQFAFVTNDYLSVKRGNLTIDLNGFDGSTIDSWS